MPLGAAAAGFMAILLKIFIHGHKEADARPRFGNSVMRSDSGA
jgi:hypothetical protein